MSRCARADGACSSAGRYSAYLRALERIALSAAFCCFLLLFPGLKKQGNAHYSAPTVLEMVGYFVCFNR